MATRMKEKAAARKANADKRPHAIVKNVRISSRKVKIVIDLIRGKKVDEAMAILMYTPKSAAPVVEKLLASAIANATFRPYAPRLIACMPSTFLLLLRVLRKPTCAA